MVRFLVLGVLTIKFGPGVVHMFGTLFRQHYYLILEAILVGLGVWLVMRRRKKKIRLAKGADSQRAT
jgi:hypothetical protein